MCFRISYTLIRLKTLIVFIHLKTLFSGEINIAFLIKSVWTIGENASMKMHQCGRAYKGSGRSAEIWNRIEEKGLHSSKIQDFLCKRKPVISGLGKGRSASV